MAHYNVIGTLLEILKIFYSCQVHNMLVFLMLDPHFKSLQFVESFVGHGNTIYLATEYDEKEVIPFFMTIFDQLNPTIEAIVPPFDEHDVQIEEEDNNMFGVGASIQDSSRALVIA